MEQPVYDELPLPMVDVIIPTYNYAPVISRAIKSVQEQTVTNLACYIVDDGSTDNTREVVQELIETDLRFHYIYQDNGGVATARNKGVFSGNGKYICCLDADDALDPVFLEACVKKLEESPTIAIAYTGLWYIKPNGQEGLSQWPGEFNYDKALEGQNQIPTCNVSRREVWERLGGQRQRYAPYGAGEEDAEMWLRACAYGFRAMKITDAGLFRYSLMSGRVSGNNKHIMTDYRFYHPWVKDGQHPLASIATPEKFSHPVRQYDEPVISVIIPVGPGHSKDIIEALDSLEAQTYRNWEAIVVWDNSESADEVINVYPYVRFVPLQNSGNGAGFARNRGSEKARGSFLVFLDADDYLHPNALEYMLIAWESEQAIVYTDHMGKAIMSEEDARKLGERLITYNDRTRSTLFKHGWKNYDCELAIRQPSKDMYHWCLVTTLIPRSWHNEIGGFDEDMSSWEDWDYYIRMAKAGKCFIRIPEPLVVYRYYTGERRENGLKNYRTLLQYMTEKYARIEIMPCGCKGSQVKIHPVQRSLDRQEDSLNTILDNDIVLAVYLHPNRGQHRVIGTASRTDYGYRGGGERFLVHMVDVKAAPHLFQVVQHGAIPQEQQRADTPPPQSVPSKPAELRDGFDLQSIAGITPSSAMELNAIGVHTLDDLLEFTPEKLMEIKGIGERRAVAIMASARLEKDKEKSDEQ